MTMEEYENLKHNHVRFFFCDLGYACCGMEATDGIITDTAPIIHWMKGKTLAEIKPYLLKHKAKVLEIPIKILNPININSNETSNPNPTMEVSDRESISIETIRARAKGGTLA